jgi:TonB family protein
MPDKNKNMRYRLPDFLRYSGGKMPGKERNAFERDLQKDPFSDEASEGYASVSTADASKDNANLQKQLKRRVAGSQRFIVYRIAASVAVLMTIATIYIMVDRNKHPKQIASVIEQARSLDITESQPITGPAGKEESSKKPASKSDEKADRPIYQQVKQEPAKSIISSVDNKTSRSQNIDSTPEIEVKPAEEYLMNEQIAAASPVQSLSKKSGSSMFSAKGKVLSSEDNLPIPGASILIKGTNKRVVSDASGDFSITMPDSDRRLLVANFIGMESKEFEALKDSVVNVRLDPSLSALSEVVVVGYGVQKTDSEKEEVRAGYDPPQPIGGKSDFDKYIRKNLKRPDSTFTGQRVVVVIRFLVHTNGSIDNIKIVSSPGKPFSDEAIRLIKSGPVWKPAMENGLITEDEVRVRIVFK